MAETTKTTPKPPPLHDRCDAFDDIAAQYNGGNNLHLVQAEFRGAMRLLRGTAIPKGHDGLILTVETDASTIGMGDDKDVHATSKWIESERTRHAVPKKSYEVEHVWPQHGGSATDGFRNENGADSAERRDGVIR